MICRITPRGALAVLLLLPGVALGQQRPLAALQIYPPRIALGGPRDAQRVGVLGDYADGRGGDLSRTAQVTSSNPKVAIVDAGNIVRPAGDGTATISVKAGGQSRTIPVSVKGAGADVLVDFAREIVPILTRAGCNQGACHGAQHGRGGFRLSLLGFDPLFDHAQIVQSAEGRRVVLSDPERSILLLKADPAHGARRRRTLQGRIAANTPTSSAGWRTGAGAERQGPRGPIASRFGRRGASWSPASSSSFSSRRRWRDGKTEDVTATAQFDTLNDAVAAVTPAGLVTAKAGAAKRTSWSASAARRPSRR